MRKVQALPDLPEEAMMQKLVNGFYALLPKNENPLQGLAGKLDWHFHGQVSRFLNEKKLAPSGVTFIPLKVRDHTVSLFLHGINSRDESKSHAKEIGASIKSIRKNFPDVKLCLSQSDFGQNGIDAVLAEAGGEPLWVTP